MINDRHKILLTKQYIKFIKAVYEDDDVMDEYFYTHDTSYIKTILLYVRKNTKKIEKPYANYLSLTLTGENKMLIECNASFDHIELSNPFPKEIKLKNDQQSILDFLNGSDIEISNNTEIYNNDIIVAKHTKLSYPIVLLPEEINFVLFGAFKKFDDFIYICDPHIYIKSLGGYDAEGVINDSDLDIDLPTEKEINEVKGTFNMWIGRVLENTKKYNWNTILRKFVDRFRSYKDVLAYKYSPYRYGVYEVKVSTIHDYDIFLSYIKNKEEYDERAEEYQKELEQYGEYDNALFIILDEEFGFDAKVPSVDRDDFIKKNVKLVYSIEMIKNHIEKIFNTIKSYL